MASSSLARQVFGPLVGVLGLLGLGAGVWFVFGLVVSFFDLVKQPKEGASSKQ